MLDEEHDDDEEDKEVGSPPKLMLMLGNRALRPSCHSFTFILFTQLPFSVWRQEERKLEHWRYMDNGINLKKKKESLSGYSKHFFFLAPQSRADKRRPKAHYGLSAQIPSFNMWDEITVDLCPKDKYLPPMFENIKQKYTEIKTITSSDKTILDIHCKCTICLTLP